MSRFPVREIPTQTKELNLGTAKVYHLPNWHELSHPGRLGVIRQLALRRGRDPRIAKLAVSIIRKKARPREYEKQAAALLAWVQNPKNCYYVNEPGERLQDPIYTIEAGFGDCDDQSALLCALFESIHLPWRLCLSGRRVADGAKVRYVEGQQEPKGVKWSHIYCMVGTPPFSPTQWWYCEPTIEKVPMGWDVVDGDPSFLPKRKTRNKGPAHITSIGKAPIGYRKGKIPPQEKQSHAYALAYGSSDYGVSSLGPFVGAAAAAGSDEGACSQSFARRVGEAVIIGTLTGLGVSLLIDILQPVLRQKLGLPSKVA